MITIYGERFEPDGRLCAKDYPAKKPYSLESAIDWLLTKELNWGGRITCVDYAPAGNVLVEIKTPTIPGGRYDKTQFRGPLEEMALFVNVAEKYATTGNAINSVLAVFEIQDSNALDLCRGHEIKDIVAAILLSGNDFLTVLGAEV